MSQADSSSDEDSYEKAEETENTSDEEGEEGERNSDADGDFSGDSDTCSDDSSAGDEDGTSEELHESEDDNDDDDKEAKLASKREDFEKLIELSAHMDNIVKRLSRYFPLESEKKEDNTHPGLPVPDLPRLPVPDAGIEPRSIGMPATANMVDRAVSARRLTTDRAVSVASGRHFEDESSGSGGSKMQDHEAVKEPSGIEQEWGRGTDTGRDSRSIHKRDQAAAMFKQETETRSDRPDVTSIPNAKREAGAPYDRRGRDAHEHVLWDELRASLATAAELEDILCRGHTEVTERSRGTVVATGEEEERRRLIEQAIAVLLEDADEEDLLETGDL